MSDGGQATDVTKVEGQATGRPDLPSDAVLLAETSAPEVSLATNESTGCLATTKAGTPCQMPRLRGSDFCWSHQDGGSLAREAGRLGGLGRTFNDPRHRGPKRNHHTVRADAPIATMPDAPLETPEQIAELRTAAIRAVQRGQMDPNTGVAISRMLTDQLRALEAVDVGRRLDALEADDAETDQEQES